MLRRWFRWPLARSIYKFWLVELQLVAGEAHFFFEEPGATYKDEIEYVQRKHRKEYNFLSLMLLQLHPMFFGVWFFIVKTRCIKLCHLILIAVKFISDWDLFLTSFFLMWNSYYIGVIYGMFSHHVLFFFTPIISDWDFFPSVGWLLQVLFLGCSLLSYNNQT